MKDKGGKCMAHFNVDIVHYHPQFAEATVKCGEIVKKSDWTKGNAQF